MCIRIYWLGHGATFVLCAYISSPEKPLHLHFGCVCWVSQQRVQRGCVTAASRAQRE